MATSDYFRRHTILSPVQAAQTRRKALESGKPIVLTDPVQDAKWARWSTEGPHPSNYFDYFFSGESIRVRLAEIPAGDPKFGDVPILQLGFSIEQEKTPVFGFWSYTYDAMMRGTRIVTGGFSIATTYPNYITDLLATAAGNRATRSHIDNYQYPRGLTEDDKLIDQYWDRHIDPVIDDVGGQHVFSVHPPFSLIIVYGLESTSVPEGHGSQWDDYYVNYYDDKQNALMTDHNERIVESDPAFENRLIIEAVELKSCERNFTPNGQLCAETYAFIARDVIVPRNPSANNAGHQAVLPSGPARPRFLE